MSSSSEKWWRGNTREDYEAFLRQSLGDEMRMMPFPECDGCGCQVYRLQLKPGAGLKRHCVACGSSRGVCGTGAAFLPGDDIPKLACPCGKNQFEGAVGFAPGTPPNAAVARRCLACGSMELVFAWTLAPGTTEDVLKEA